jgi:DNA (cytosine-5)-methyltransferase 1
MDKEKNKPEDKQAKPPYVVKTMQQINRIKKRFTVASTFSGAGGSCTGYKMAGFKVLWANEFIKDAQDSYRLNHKSTYLNTEDIRKVDVKKALAEMGLKKGALDLFDGSPPCQSFSMAGKRESGWGKHIKHGDGSSQVSDDLFFEYARLLKGLQPKVFVAENVGGLVRGTAKGYFKIIFKELCECGYRVEAKLLNAKWLGVPQNRQRIIFIGVRNDLDISPVFPKPLPYFSTGMDAVERVHTITHGGHGYFEGANYNMSKRPYPTVLAGGFGASYKLTCEGNHGTNITIDELKAICGFPHDYKLTGTYKQQWARLGNAVPPVMMFHVANLIAKNILSK